MTTAVENISEEQWAFKISPWITMIPIMLTIIMFALDETISNVALPYMAGSFSVSHNESTWIITSYLVASGITIPAVDYFSKLFGRKQYLLMSVIVFTIASFLCGVSNSMAMMLFARILQGIGGGGIMPIGQAIIFEIFPKEKLSQAMAIFGLGVVVAPIMGPAIGGWITDNWSWPYIYFINVPLGFLALFLVSKFVEEPPYSRKQKNVSLDFSGFFFLAIWLLSLQIVLEKGNDADWFNAAWICKLSAVSFVAAIIFFGIQIYKSKKNASPLIDLNVFKNHNFTIGTAGQVVLMGVMMASSSFLPSMLQSLLGYSSFLSGISMMPRGAGCLLASIISTPLILKFGIRAVAIAGLIVLAIAGIMFGEINLQISLASIAIPNCVFGLGMVLAMMPLANISCSTLQNSAQTNAAGVQNMVKNIGAAIGTSISTTMISRLAQAHQMMMVKGLNESSNIYIERLNAYTSSFLGQTDFATASYMAKYQLYNMLKQQATLWGYIDTFRYFAIAAVVIIPFVCFLHEVKTTNSAKN